MKRLTTIICLLSLLSVFAQQKKVIIIVAGSGTYNVQNLEIKRYKESLVTPISNSHLARLDTWCSMLKDSLAIDSLAQRFDVYAQTANEEQGASLRNLVKRAHDATASGSPAWVQWQGYTGSNNNYLIANYNPISDGVTYTLNNASMGVYTRKDVSESFGVIGRSFATGGSAFIQVRRTTGSAAMRLNDLTDVFNNFSANATGMYIASRTDTTTLNLYRNSVPGAGYTTPTTGLYAGAVGYLVLTANASQFSENEIAAYFFGSGFTAEEVRKITNCQEWYMDDLGKGVIP